MAPSLEEPIQVDLTAPLKVAPKLVAPEPGNSSPDSALHVPNKSLKSIVLGLNRTSRGQGMPAPVVPTNPYAPQPRKAQILTSPSSPRASPASNIKSSF